MKRILFIFSLILMLGFVFGCSQSEVSKLERRSNALGVGVMAVDGLLNNESVASLSATEEINMEKVNEYLQTMEKIINDSFMFEELESDLIDYQKKLVFTSKTLSGESVTYTIYYNEISEIEEDDDDFDFEIENEKEYRLEGIAIVGEYTYKIVGEYEEEDDEKELEMKIVMDNNNYCVIEREFERNESEYVYNVYKDGKLYSKVSLEEEGELLKAQLISFESGEKESYNFKKTTDQGKELIKIQYKKGQLVLNIVVKGILDSETNEIVYEYKILETNQKFKFHGEKQEKDERHHHGDA